MDYCEPMFIVTHETKEVPQLQQESPDKEESDDQESIEQRSDQS